MAKCELCGQQMTGSTSCLERTVELHGKIFNRDASYYDLNARCHDCGIVNISGNIHHAACDMERCPCCKGQLISCGCLEEDSECDHAVEMVN